jgi:hypothetical protein
MQNVYYIMKSFMICTPKTFCSSDKSKEVEMGERRDANRVLVGKPEGKRPLRRLMRRWEDNNKMDVKELG